MYEKLNTVTIGGHKLPIKCDFNILQVLQENFETLRKFEQALIGMVPILDKDGNPQFEYSAEGEEIIKFRTTEPSLKAIALALPMMINEGRQQSIAQGDEPDNFDYKAAIKEADFSITEVAVALHNEYRRCFDRKKLRVSKRTATKK
jgi:hypothetical protein